MRPRRHVAILGPTATGKTALAIDVAETLRGSVSPPDLEILSFDSVQFYRELAIGSARPSHEQLRRVKHHFVAQQSVREEMTAGRFASEAQELMAEASPSVEFIIVGGSGFYWQALERGVPNVPASTPESRAQIEAHVAAIGLQASYAELLLRDAETAKRIHPHDQYRIVRALEILATLPAQETWSALRARHESAQAQIALRAKIGLELSREDLERQVAQRTSHDPRRSQAGDEGSGG
jgi:tRNA dimethylallyltransferase